MRPRPRPTSAFPRASLSRRAAVGPGIAEGRPCVALRPGPHRSRGTPKSQCSVDCPPTGIWPALSGGGVEPVPLHGLRQGCSAGKLTCAGAPPLGAGCLPCPFSSTPRGAELPAAAPLRRLCLLPRAPVLALILPCLGAFSQAPGNLSYPRGEGSTRLTLLADGFQATPSSPTCSQQMNVCTPLRPNPGPWVNPRARCSWGQGKSGPRAVGGVGLCCKVTFANILYLRCVCDPLY